MKEEIKLYNEQYLSIKDKFFLLMHILVSNQFESKFEYYIFNLIYSLQIFTSFSSEQIGTFFPKDNISDDVYYVIQKILRVGDLLKGERQYFNYSIYIIFCFLLFFTFYFIICLFLINFKSLYTTNLQILNFMIKFLFYILFNIVIYIFSLQLCFSNGFNPYFNEIKCSQSNNIFPFAISTFSVIYIYLLLNFLCLFYSNSFFIYSTPYSKCSCFFDNYSLLVNFILHLSSGLVKELYREIFFFINIISSITLLNFYYLRFPFFDTNSTIINFIIYGNYLWTLIYCFTFSYIEMSEKALFLFLSWILIFYIIYISFKKFEDKLFKKTNSFTINNKFYLFYYIKEIYKKLSDIEMNVENQKFLVSIIQLHSIECQMNDCPLKTLEKLYLPISNEWSDRTKPFIFDRIFLKHFIMIIMRYFIKKNFFCAQIILNISLYNLKIIGNYCISFYYFQKIKRMKLNIMEYFLIKRMELIFKEYLTEKLKLPNEQCMKLKYLNVSYYFEYVKIFKNFVKEINNDIDFNIKFWNYFERHKKKNETLDYNKVFFTIDEIVKSKKNINELWKKIFDKYNGINEIYNYYLDYIGNINDDSHLKRNLENYKMKRENNNENLNLNYYNKLFNPELGIAIINGDKETQGIIEMANNEFVKIFKYKHSKIKGKLLNDLIPKIFAKEHDKYMDYYYNIGESDMVNIKEKLTFGIDKNNHLLTLIKYVKIFPVLNNSLMYIAMILLEKIDDNILIDNNFNIQAMSSKLIEKLHIHNKYLFIENEIPFYVICKQFLNFYKIFLIGQKKVIKNEIQKKSDPYNSNISAFEDKDKKLEISKEYTDIIDTNTYNENESNNNNINLNNEDKLFSSNVEINENIELEYEIKFPKFLIDFSKITKFKNHIKTVEKNNINNNIYDNEEKEKNESDLLLEKKAKSAKEIKFKFNENILNKKTPNSKTPFIPNLNISKKFNKNNLLTINENESIISFENKNLNENSEEYFLKILNKFKIYFKEKNYDELENLIDFYGDKPESIIYKFNFTFTKFLYGKNKYCYMIRCINNKTDKESSSEEIITGVNENAINFFKHKINDFNITYNIYKSEYNEFFHNILYFFEKANDENINIIIKNNSNIIKLYSSVLGNHSKKNALDENASQTANASYNNDLSKLNRIEEIRSNILHQKIKENAVKYLKIISFVYILITIIFFYSFLLENYEIYGELTNVNNFNNYYILLIINISNIMNIIFDIYAMFDIKINNLSYVYYHINEDEKPFFERKKNSIKSIYKESLLYIFSLEKISVIFKSSQFKWIKIQIEPFDNFPLNVYEYIFFVVDQNLYNSYCFYINDKFTINDSIYNINEDNLFEILYNKYNVIERAYNYIIINLIVTHPHLLSLFKQLSKKKSDNSNLQILIYVIIIFIISCLFYFTIEYEKKKMSNGIRRISKISYEKITLMIKKLKKFKEFYNKKFEINSLIDYRIENKLENNYENFLDYKSLEETSELTQSLVTSNNNGNNNKNFDNNEFNIEKKELISLKIMNEVIYLIILIASITFFCLIFLILNIHNLIKSQNELMESESYLLENFMKINANIIQTKCLITNCENLTSYDINNILNETYYKTLIKTLENFPRLNDFFYNKFNQDYCLTMYDEDTEEYKSCIEITKLENTQINSTSGLLTISENIIQQIYDIYLYNFEKNNSFDGYEIFSFYQYDYITYINDNFLMPVIPKVDKVIHKCFDDIISEKKTISYILLIILALIAIAHYIFDLYYLLPKLMNYLKISKNFIQIIPSSLIFQTVELENYIDALDNNKNK